MSTDKKSPPFYNHQLAERGKLAAEVMKITEAAMRYGLEELGIGLGDEDGIALLEAETTREGDARRIFVDNGIKVTGPSGDGVVEKAKPARFLAGWAILKGKGEVKEGPDTEQSLLGVIQNLRPIHTLKDRELLTHLRPDASSEIVEELLKRSHGRPFVIYQPDGETVDMDNTLLMLRTARRHETKQYHGVIRGGSMVEVRVYRADEFPKTWFEECPLHPGVMLTNGYCDKCSESWQEVGERPRVVARIARDINAIGSSLADIHNLIEGLRDRGSEQLMKIPAVHRRFEELHEEDNLPKLKKRLSSTKNGKKDPLFQHKTY